jgi:hypothetical protein
VALAETGKGVTDRESLPDRRVVVTALGVTQILAWGSTFYLLTVLVGRLALPLLIAMAVSPYLGRLVFQTRGVDWKLGILAVLALSNVVLVGVLRFVTLKR